MIKMPRPLDFSPLEETLRAFPAGEIERMEREREEREFEKFFSSTVPERFRGESFATFQEVCPAAGFALARARGFAEAVIRGEFRTSLFLGYPGTGKTHLACSVIRECRRGVYVMSSSLTGELRRARSFSSRETEEQILSRYGAAPLLVIDEIGRGIQSGEEQYSLYQVLNERYNRRKPTLFISNQDKTSFLAYLGFAAVDRLTESAETVEFNWPSVRASLCRRGKGEAG